jgi:hypothetical protein
VHYLSPRKAISAVQRSDDTALYKTVRDNNASIMGFTGDPCKYALSGILTTASDQARTLLKHFKN